MEFSGNISRVGCLEIKIREVLSGVFVISKSSLPDMCVYAHGLHVGGEDLYGGKSFFSNNDYLRSYLVNGDVAYLMRV